MGKTRAFLTAIAVLVTAGVARADPAREVSTVQGKISGVVVEGMAAFKGIPFARPPVGNRRWKPPVPAAPWSGVRPATAFAPACMQLPNPGMNDPSQPVSEDCLYLNVWTRGHKGQRLPVIVWIHGGAFSYGSTAMPIFSGAALAKKGVVFVSIAYRLGPIGFLAHPGLSKESLDKVSGNYGLLDQIAGLRWVAANVAAFGGDPKRVTIMGESAGAMSVGMLAQSPLARGLFRGVIAQSGAGFSVPDGLVVGLSEAEANGKAWANSLGAKNLAELRALPAEKLLSATPANPALRFAQANSWPVRDGKVLPHDAAEAYRKGRFNDTPILIGCNADEGVLFWPSATRDAYLAKLQQRYGAVSDKLLSIYPAPDDNQAKQADSALIGDTIFRLPQLLWARAQIRFGRGAVFYYHFAQNPPPRPGAIPGAIHGSELPYALANQWTRNLAWTKDDRDLAELMNTYWTNFAKTGDPNGGGVPYWRPFSDHGGDVAWFYNGGMNSRSVADEPRLVTLAAILDTQGQRGRRQ